MATPFPTRTPALADQQTQTLTKEQLATSLHQSRSASVRIEPRHLEAAHGDIWQATALVLAEEAHLVYRATWLTQHDLSEPLGAHGVEQFHVPSVSRDWMRHTVTYDATTDTYRCDCEAGIWAKPCKHAGAVLSLVRQLQQLCGDRAERVAREQLAYEMLCEDIERQHSGSNAKGDRVEDESDW